LEHGTNFSAGHYGAWADFARYEFKHPRRPQTAKGKRFLRDDLRLTAMEISLNSLPPGAGLPFLHAHRENEELYLFVRGRGQMLVDGEVIEVGEGSAVRVATAGERAWRNTGTEPLHYLVIQAPAGGIRGGTTDDGVRVERELVWPHS
jgi:mannose-6-phosphate isomerase-like protein (cupin superfamily)